MKSKAVLMVVSALIPAAFAYYSGANLQAQTHSTSTEKSGVATVTISISGMSCGSCAMQIKSELAKSAGVKSAEVSYEKGQAVVRYDTNSTSAEAIRSVIESLGYKADESKTAEGKPASASATALAELPIGKLKEEFNHAIDKVRVLAILSPTCDACQRGRSVVAEVFDKEKSEKLAGFVVWLPMKPKDGAKAAGLESEKLKDERISVRAWDGNRGIGKLFATPLKLSHTAWDVYLVYAAGTKWEGNEPPTPNYWMHQLRGQKADTMLCLNPSVLSAQVQRFLKAER